MVNITFPDSTKKVFENNPTGFDIAKSISEGFARTCVAMEINGEPADLSREVQAGCQYPFYHDQRFGSRAYSPSYRSSCHGPGDSSSV
jgi:hypothetical protein